MKATEMLIRESSRLGEALEALVEAHSQFNYMCRQIRERAKLMPREPRIKVSPYAKFDKYHKKKRK